MSGSKSFSGDSDHKSPVPRLVSRPLGYRLFVRDLVLPCRIGVHRHERDAPQRVRVSVELDIRDISAPGQDAIDEVVSYDDVVAGIRQLVGSEHINLVESLAERIVEFCLEDERVARARVIVEKLDVLGDDTTVGVEIERTTDT